MIIASLVRRSAAVAVILGSVTIAASTEAQSSAGSRRAEAGRGFFEVGYLGLDLGDLNEVLAPAGFPKMSENFLTLGGGGFADHGRWLIGGEGHGLMGRNQSTVSGAYDLSLSGGYGMFRVGYKVVSERDFDVYPTIGVGGGGMQLTIRGRSAPTFDDILANPARSSHLSAGSFLLGVGVNGNYRISMHQRRRGEEGGVLIGLGAGYVLSPGTGNWRLDGINSVAGGPAVKIEGFYARVSFGGWGRKSGAD